MTQPHNDPLSGPGQEHNTYQGTTPTGTPGSTGMPTGAPAGLPGDPTNPAAPAAPVQKKSNLGKILGAILGVLVLLGAFFGIRMLMANAGMPKVGDCVVVKDASNSQKALDKVSCDDTGKFHYQVAIADSKDAQCPNSDHEVYDTFTRGTGNDQKTYCLAPHLVKDKCYYLENQSLVMVDCNDSKAALRVTEKLNEADATKCSTKSAWAYPALKTTYCVENK